MKKNAKKWLRILTIVLLTVTYHPVSAHAVYFQNIGIKEGLSQLSVMSIHQDVMGRIWFGTLEGLSIYDGRQMITLKGGDDLFDRFIKGNEIRCIVENAAHDIFFMADNALIEYKFASNQFRRVRESGVTSVSSIQGRIYVSANDSILLWDESTSQLQHFLETKGKIRYIHSIRKDSSGSWWIASGTGLYKQQDGQWNCIIPNTSIWGVYESRSKELWIATNSGLYVISKEGKKSHFVHDPLNSNSISSDKVRKVVEDRDGNFWIGTFKGLNKYSPAENKFEVYVEGYLPGNLRHSSIHSMLLDNQDNIWVGTYYGGASLFTPSKQLYNYYPAGMSKLGHLDFHLVGQMVEDNRHDLWICTDGGGLNFMERETGQFRSFDMKHSSIRSDNLKSICYDAETEKLYFALYSEGVSSYDIQSGKFENLERNMGEGYSKNAIKVSMHDGQLFYLSGSGVFKMDTRSREITPLLLQTGCQAFFVDSGDILWVLHGFEVIRLNLRQKEDMKRLDLKSLGFEYGSPLCISEASDGHIFIGTQGAGIIECDNLLQECRYYTAKQNGLLDDYCYAMANTRSGKLILLSDKGLSYFNPESKKVENVIMVKNLPIAGFNDGNGLLIAANGDIFAGSTDGLIIFPGEAVQTSNRELSLYFSNLFVNNKQVYPGDESGVLDQILCYTKKISLSHDLNTIALTFSNNNFGNRLSSPSYEYKLEGFDVNWISVTDIHQLTYTQLPPGKYTLRVREVNLYGTKSAKEASLAITIRQPFYNTPLAWAIYILSAALILYFILAARRKQVKLKQSLENEKREKEHIEEMDSFKFKFFTNISHELRTPLTLIITQAELLMNSKAMAFVFKNKVKQLYNNANYMSNLINELLDFHKLEQKQMHLKVSRRNIVPFVKDIFESFKEKAMVQNIRCNFIAHEEEILCWFDAVQLRKVFFNLISNALKYNKEGGSVEVIVSKEGDECVIQVIDTGLGISKEDTQKIFDNFYRATTERDIIGSGIGLALSKEIVELHHGRIKVTGMVGYGSVFTVNLAMKNDCFLHDSKVELTIEQEDGTETVEKTKLRNTSLLPDTEEADLQERKDTEEIVRELQKEQDGKASYSILIVEDDSDLRAVLAEIFSGLYHVLEATNGKEGWTIAQEELPDIVLGDVMMPEMDGLEMCRKIKNTEKTRHIPVVLLTAAGSTEQQIDGLRTGADDYLTKPFDMKLLLLKVGAILRSHVMLKNMLKKGDLTDLGLSVRDEQEHQWLLQIEQIVQTHMGDYDFTVDKLADELKQSRSYVFKKIKMLKGVTPADFILGIRLKASASLLLDYPDLQVEEIAMKVGFGSGRYFSKVFKEYFNMTPSHYRKVYNTNC